MNFECLKGHILKEVKGLETGSESVVLITESGESFRMYHQQDCCEIVEIESIVGDVEDIIGSNILLAEESTDSYDGNEGTWTFYKLGTIKGYLDIRWHGKSNGYYSESVNFEKIRSEAVINET
jgi:hypothetical protein